MSDGSESGLSGECIGGTADRSQAVIHQVRVDHGGLDVLMAHQFLDHADVVTGFQEVRGEARGETYAYCSRPPVFPALRLSLSAMRQSSAIDPALDFRIMLLR